MKSIKPGRGPSMMGGFMGIIVALFGVFWTVMAVSMGAGFMGIFGIIFVVVAIVQAVYNFKNATGKNRYSTFDIVDEHEEEDPFNQRFGAQNSSDIWGQTSSVSEDNRFCPYCGTAVGKDFEFCNKCGKKLP